MNIHPGIILIIVSTNIILYWIIFGIHTEIASLKPNLETVVPAPKINLQASCVSYKPCRVSNEIKQMSFSLNEAMRQIGILSCELTEIKDKKTDGVSGTGGWCSKISGKQSTHHITDQPLANFISGFLKGKRVASFGDGPGIYKNIILGKGEVASFDSFDGAPYAEATTNGDVVHLDLSVPVYHLPLYDWIMSLEVAEHIPAEYEQIFIDNLTRHAKEGIILSWSTLGQDGHSHVNNRNVSYVVEQMEFRGFKLDMDKSNMLKNAATADWLKRNNTRGLLIFFPFILREMSAYNYISFKFHNYKEIKAFKLF